jgi:quercetin dioxygenase-like cupin family protein
MTTGEPQPLTDVIIADLGSVAPTNGQGAVWSLPHGGDLDANLVRLDPGGTIDEHVNDDVDVLMFVQSGSGCLTVDTQTYALRSDVLVLIPRGARRRLTAGPNGMFHLSIHRRRGPLTITTSR